ncbi:MAG: SMP-30/gluconolactonase/LRE family protein [Vicinamibacteraceae bacterium]
MDVEQITEPLADHGEGPTWDAKQRAVHWVDMLAGDVLSLGRSGHVTRRHVGDVAAAIRPRRNGGLVIGIERGFAVLDADGARLRVVAEAWQDPSVRMNDGTCDPQGRFYCGSTAYDVAKGRGQLYRLDPDGTVHVVLEGVTVSNGLAWSPDGTTVFYVDSPTQRIDAFDFDPDTATFANRRAVVHIPAETGGPDGMTVDAEGYLWVALWDGGAVRRYAPDGRLDTVLELPVRRVTACAFGGPNLDELYVTTSRYQLPEGAQRQAGALFRARPGVRGLPVAEYAG